MSKIENLASVFNSIKKAESRWNLYMSRRDDSTQKDCAIEHTLDAIKIAEGIGDKELNESLKQLITAFANYETEGVGATLHAALNRTAELICILLNV